MKRRLAAILAIVLMLCISSFAEEEWGDDFGFGAFDDGYDGSWVQVDALGVEFCLPDGWHETQASDSAAYAAESDRGDASLSIRLAARNVNDLAAWGAANLKGSQAGEANFYDVLLTDNTGALSVYLIVSDGDVLAFDFTRSDEDALTRQFALQIVGSACAIWDDDVPFMEGDEGFDFDFGEAFDAELG